MDSNYLIDSERDRDAFKERVCLKNLPRYEGREVRETKAKKA